MIKGRGVPFTLLLLVLVLRPHLAGGTYPFVQGLFLVPLLVSIALICLIPGRTGGLTRGTAAILILPWVLLVWALVSMAWTSDPGQGIREIAALFCNVAVFTLVFFLVYEEGWEENRSVGVLALILLPVLASSFYQRVIGLDRIREALKDIGAGGVDVTDLTLIVSDNRIFAGFLNPNMLAGFLLVTICLTLDMFLAGKGKRRFVLAALLALQCAAILMTGSAGGTAAALVTAGAVILLRQGSRARTIMILGCAAVAAGAGLLIIRGSGFISGPESSLLQRGGYMAAGLNMALVNPLLGWGTGAVPGALMGFVSAGIRPVSDPHNFLIRSWIAWGLPGLAVILLFLWLWTHRMMKELSAAWWRNAAAGYTGLVFGGVAFMLHSLVDMDFFVPETALFGWCAFGGALGIAAAREGRHENIAKPLAGYRMAAGGLALLMVLPAFLYLQAESTAFRGKKASEESNYREAVSYYSRARDLLPFSGRFALEEGRARLAAGQRAGAIKLFERAGSLMSASPYPSWELGRAAQAVGDWERSVTYLKAALEKYASSPRIRIDLARAYLNLGQKAQAIRILEDAGTYAVFDTRAKLLIDDVLDKIGP
jgi:hypothetical protein